MTGWSWSEQISSNFRCGNCRGAIRKDGSAPIFKGYIMRFKCIRCSSTGTVKDKLGRELELNGNIERGIGR